MRVLVTGAASPLGRHVCAALVGRNHRVVGLVRRRNGIEAMRSLGVEPVLGDPRVPHTLMRGITGCEIVYHLASFFDFWTRDEETYDSVNVVGTRNVMAAALVAGVRRVVLCSSALTIGQRTGEVGDEFTPHSGRTRSAFERSALAAERLALRLRERGMEVVVVNPSLVISPGDPGWTGRLLARAVDGRQRVAGHAPLGWVWVEDAASGVMLAGERGADGARYILSGTEMSSHALLRVVAQSAGAPAPLALPRHVAIGAAAVSTAVARSRGNRPGFALDEATLFSTGFRVDGRHAVAELGVRYTPAARFLPLVVDNYRSALERFRRR